jgi:hypothetical protein
VKLRTKEIVYKPNEPIDHVLFPENAVLCLMGRVCQVVEKCERVMNRL